MAFARPTSLGTGFGHFGAGIGGSVFTGPAPTLSAASAAAFSDVFVWGQATTDTASGTLYAVVVASAASTPSAAQIVAGTDAAGAAAPNGNVGVSSTGAKALLVRNLTAVTAYKVCFAHQAGGLNSNVVTASFTTDTLVIAFATNGLATNMNFQAGNGSAAAGTNQADPHGGTNAIRWVDVNDAATNIVLASCTVAAFFNGVNKVHFTTKYESGGAWLRLNTTNITITAGVTHWNTSTGAIGTNSAGWTPTPTTFDVGSGWRMWSAQANLAGADLNGFLSLWKGPSDNNNTLVRDGTHVSYLYNLRITRV
jgi:hypothetical protein